MINFFYKLLYVSSPLLFRINFLSSLSFIIHYISSILYNFLYKFHNDEVFEVVDHKHMKMKLSL